MPESKKNTLFEKYCNYNLSKFEIFVHLIPKTVLLQGSSAIF